MGVRRNCPSFYTKAQLFIERLQAQRRSLCTGGGTGTDTGTHDGVPVDTQAKGAKRESAVISRACAMTAAARALHVTAKQIRTCRPTQDARRPSMIWMQEDFNVTADLSGNNEINLHSIMILI
jgi:hypothetical protein